MNSDPSHIDQLLDELHDGQSHHDDHDHERIMRLTSDSNLDSSLDSNLHFFSDSASHINTNGPNEDIGHSFHPLSPPLGNQEEGTCSRCKKIFVQDGPKTYRLCAHCRELQRLRSRRWQQRNREKDGVCTRCGALIPEDQNQFVLCPPCRKSLRSKKASRGLQGKCVHCSRKLDSEKMNFKVCSRCRENDRNRRRHLEDNGYCIRCAKPLVTENAKYKICELCRERRNNPNLLPNARLPSILNAAYRQELLRQQRSEGDDAEKLISSSAVHMGDHNGDEDDDDVLSAAQLMIPNYSPDNYDSHLSNELVSASLSLVLTLADEHSLLESHYFNVHNK